MKHQSKFQVFHILFDLGVVGKGIDGLLEIVGGVLLFLISPERLQLVVRVLTQHELSEDPKDQVANYLLNSTHDLTKGATIFAATYLLWHGMVKAGLVAGLLLKRRWAYPAAIFAFALFLVYQLYRYTHTHSVWLLALSIVDALVIVLTWIEYEHLKSIHGFVNKTQNLS